MATHTSPLKNLFVYLLILSYAWTIGKGPVCELYLSVAHTAAVMNSQLYGSTEHHHSQDIAQLKFGKLQADLETDQELPPQSKSTQAPEKQKVYSNQLADFPEPAKRKARVCFFWYQAAANGGQRLPTPPPKFVWEATQFLSPNSLSNKSDQPVTSWHPGTWCKVVILFQLAYSTCTCGSLRTDLIFQTSPL